MVLFLSLREGARSIDPATAWTIIVTLAGVIGAMGVWFAKREISRANDIKALYEERIKGLKGDNELLETMLERIERERKGGR